MERGEETRMLFWRLCHTLAAPALFVKTRTLNCAALVPTTGCDDDGIRRFRVCNVEVATTTTTEISPLLSLTECVVMNKSTILMVGFIDKFVFFQKIQRICLILELENISMLRFSDPTLNNRKLFIKLISLLQVFKPNKNIDIEQVTQSLGLPV